MTTSTTAAVQAILPGEYVKRKESAKATDIRGAYNRGTQRYELIDTEDTNRVIYVKRDTMLHAVSHTES